MIGMEVREEDVLEGERHAVAHHLSLRALAAIEEQGLTFAHHCDGRNVALDRGAGGGSAEQADRERHGGEI